MMPGISRALHEYIYRWWAKHRTRVEFYHTISGMDRLNWHWTQYGGEPYFLDHPHEVPWRVTPAVFQMFRLHMRARHGRSIEEISAFLERGVRLGLCCRYHGIARFYL